MGWPRADGTLVHVIAAGIPDDTLANMARSIETAVAEGRAPLTELGDGLALRRRGSLDLSPSRHGEVTYRGPENRTVDLRLLSGGPTRLDGLVLDRLASAGSWRALTVGRQPAVESTYADGPEAGPPTRAVMWMVRPGVVAELVARGLSDEEIGVALASIEEVDEVKWDALVAKTAAPNRPTDSGPPAAESGTESLHTAFLAELCKASSVWLHAIEVGDAGGRDTVAADIHSVRDKGEAAGLGRDGDIIVIADRIVAAVDAGDADAVRSERSVCP